MRYTRDTFNGQFNEVKPGDEIIFRTSPDPTNVTIGKAYGKFTDRWGRHIRVKVEDGTFTTVEGFTTVGIGAYWTPNSPLRTK